MRPISNYEELLEQLSLNDQKGTREGWFIFLLMNPQNQTSAGMDIIKNISYLNTRTKNVVFFLPGFSNTDVGVVPLPSRYGDRVVYKDDRFGKLYLDEEGFLDTIQWLEDSNPSYRYSEDLELVIVRYRQCNRINIDLQYSLSKVCHAVTHFIVEPINRIPYDKNFDLRNMIVYNLDNLKREGINIIRMITECMRVVSVSDLEREVRQGLENFIFDNIGVSNKHWHSLISVFVAGAKALNVERDAVISSLSHVTSNSSRGYAFCVKTYEDFDRSLSEEGRQKDYNDFISNDAEYAIFILDSSVGGITFNEFEVAMNSYREHKRPEIFVYSRVNDNEDFEMSREIQTIRNYRSEIDQYYIEYKDIDDLKNHIRYDFRRYGL